jgi:hypothetical protein
MALSFKHQPTSGTSFLPAYNDNIYVVSESASGTYSQFNFRFNCVIQDYAGGLPFSITMLKAPIYYNSTNKGVFNIGRILENYVSYDWDYNDTAASGCINSVFAYQSKFGYEYSTGATSPIVLSTGVTNEGVRKVWNAALTPEELMNYAEEDYRMATGSTANFLTHNLNKRIHIDQKDWLYALHAGVLNRLDVVFSPSGSTTISGTAQDITRFPIGANIPGGIPIGTKSYTITPKNSAGTTVGSPYTITIDDRCSKYDNVDLYFLNRLGGVESFRFDMLRRQSVNYNRKSYNRNPYTLDNTAITYTYDSESHWKTDYYTDEITRFTLNSNFITEGEADWLKELIGSPYVWMYDGTLKAVNIRTSEYERKYHVNDKVFNLTLEVEVSAMDKSQRR